jgi:N-dimethylarginine dimethylaminohydrolase
MTATAPTPLRARLEAGGTPRPATWGVDSEYGVLRDVLLGPCDHFSWFPANAVAARSERIGLVYDLEVAKAQHRALAAAFEAAGVAVHRLRPDGALRYQVYARDSSVLTPWGALILQLQRPQRRGEYAECVRFYVDSGIPIFDMVTAGTLEGGDLMVLAPGVAVCGLSGERSGQPAVDQVKSWFEAEGWEFHAYAFDPHFLHLDLQLGVIAEGLAVVCVEAVEPAFVDWLMGKKIRILEVTYREAMTMGCNVVALGAERVMIPAANTRLIGMCRAEGLTVIEVDVSMIAAGGGAVHCLCQPLRRDPAA